MMDNPWTPLTYHPSFGHELMFEGDSLSSSNYVQLNPNLLEGPMHSSIPSIDPKVTLLS